AVGADEAIEDLPQRQWQMILVFVEYRIDASQQLKRILPRRPGRKAARARSYALCPAKKFTDYIHIVHSKNAAPPFATAREVVSRYRCHPTTGFVDSVAASVDIAAAIMWSQTQSSPSALLVATNWSAPKLSNIVTGSDVMPVASLTNSRSITEHCWRAA